MIIIVGYVPKPEGRAALGRAIEEAKLRGGRLVVVNASRGDALVDAGYAGVQEIELVKSRLAESGVPYELRQLVRAPGSAMRPMVSNCASSQAFRLQVQTNPIFLLWRGASG